MAEGGDEEQDDSQKTEDPTRKRLEEARKEGQVPLSREANTWLMLFAGTMIILLAGPSMMREMTEYLTGLLQNSGSIRVSTQQEAGRVMGDMALAVLGFLAIPFIVFFAAAIAGPVAQIGFLFSAKSITPSIDKIDPMKGMKRIFSLRSVMEFIKGILKLVVIGAVCTAIIMPILPTIDQHIGQSIPMALQDIKDIVRRLLIAILAALFLVALIDVIYVRLDYNKRMRMTRQQVRDEYKQTEGDPHVRARLRQLRTERARKRMIQSVPKADVVIVNPDHYSVALQYEPAKMDAPTVIAKGLDSFALRIREVAKENNVPVVENPPLARSLHASVEVDEQIPPELYQAVAEIIKYVFNLKGRRPAR